ncbi:HD domain-containing protein [Candidatus Bathyarchaeota archaeon]|nr:HD domain-containing protein [Candidatus Bathyarchaeota archaeon]MBS7630233.1 HD domain-containing protein [Candidatus Bathyarchaeota archaeon]
MSIKLWGEIKDPVHGYIYLSELEKRLIDSPPMQRLRRIRQLSAAYLTYPGAEHTRFSHSLGVMQIAGEIADHLRELGALNEEDVSKARIAGLLHDIGHGPFSHLYEEVLEKRGVTHEDLSRLVIRESEVSDMLKDQGYDVDEISKLSIGVLNGKILLNQIIAGQFSADVMDYLVRDSYFTGVEYGRIDIKRLINSLDVTDGRLVMDIAALYALEAFMIARYEMFKAVYFHRTVRAAAVMLVRAMKYVDDKLGLSSFRTVDEFLEIDDSSLMNRLLSLKGARDKSSQIAYELTVGFRNRRLLKCAYEKIVHRRDTFMLNILNRGEVRNDLENEIASRAGVDPNFVMIDVSTATSVPQSSERRMDEPQIFTKASEGSKNILLFRDLSPVVSSLTGYLDIIRVYTKEEDLEPVKKSVRELFDRESTATKISY